jgi:acetyltransferase-like isoleucine patch superfamily enzyme
MAIKHLLRIGKYPIYFTDLILIRFYKIKWRMMGIIIGRTTNFLGIPFITKCNNSRITIGQHCVLCSRAEQTALGVSHPVILRTLNSNAELIIGNNVRMSGTSICAANLVTIGDRCVIGADVIIADTDFHSIDSRIRSSIEDSLYAVSLPTIIGNDVFIGGRSTILKGVTLGDNVVIGAGSVVTKSFVKGSIVAGNPAKIIGRAS